jgi:hypothetical protein
MAESTPAPADRSARRQKHERFFVVLFSFVLCVNILYMNAFQQDKLRTAVTFGHSIQTRRVLSLRIANCIIIDHFSAFESGLVALSLILVIKYVVVNVLQDGLRRASPRRCDVQVRGLQPAGASESRAASAPTGTAATPTRTAAAATTCVSNRCRRCCGVFATRHTPVSALVVARAWA